MLNLLFVCSRNEWRSRTAETIFKNEQRFNVKSAGTSSSARIRINQNLIDWADKILVMEDKHKIRLTELFGELPDKEIIVLGIPDEYKYMDEELVEELRHLVDYYIEV